MRAIDTNSFALQPQERRTYVAFSKAAFFPTSVSGHNSPTIIPPTAHHHLQGNYPYVVPTSRIDMEVKGELIALTIWEAESYKPTSCYQGAHAFLLCFSIDDPSSLDDLVSKWDPELKQFGGGAVPRFLVGCKKDLRADEDTVQRLSGSGRAPVSVARGEEVGRAIGARAYVECSSKTSEGVREVFQRATESMEAGKVARYKHKKGPQRQGHRARGRAVA